MKGILHTFTTNERNVKHAAMLAALHHDYCQLLVIITTLGDLEGPGWQIDSDSDNFRWDFCGMGRGTYLNN